VLRNELVKNSLAAAMVQRAITHSSSTAFKKVRV